MKFFLFTLYNYIALPFLFVTFKILSLFNAKIRKGLKERENLFLELEKKLNKINEENKTIWFHSASMGEFEQAKPIIQKLKEEKHVNIVVSFFSPSGYENSKRYPYADVITYIPLDTRSNAIKITKIINPDIIIFMRYDIWPNLVSALNKNSIPCFIVDATMRKDSLRKLPISKSFHKILYSFFNRILTVSKEDTANFMNFGLDETKVENVGDTRFDRVYQKSIVAKEKKLFPNGFFENKKVFVLGSSWEADEEVLIPAIKKILSLDENTIVIIVPHEPTIIRLEKLEHIFCKEFKTIRFSYLNNYSDERIILIDSIGILLTLYYYADAAYVGGSFKQGIHSVLEPAVYGIPVLFGPKIENSQEAQILKHKGGAIEIQNKKEAYKILRKLFSDEAYRKQVGKISSEYVNANIGPTQKIFNEVVNIINI